MDISTIPKTLLHTCWTCKEIKHRDEFVRTFHGSRSNCSICRKIKREKVKKLHDSNKEKYDEPHKYITCDCGTRLKKGNLKGHLTTKKHKKFVEK